MTCAACDHGWITYDDGTVARCGCLVAASAAQPGTPVSSDPTDPAARSSHPDAIQRSIVHTGRLPRRPTRRQRVLHALRDHQWHDGHALCAPDIGGSEGLRRLRELRADGWTIDKRQRPGTSTVQYRLRQPGVDDRLPGM